MSIALLDTNVVINWIKPLAFLNLTSGQKNFLAVEDIIVDRKYRDIYYRLKDKHDKLMVTPYVLWEIIPQNISYIVESKSYAEGFFQGYDVIMDGYALSFKVLGIEVVNWSLLQVYLASSHLSNKLFNTIVEELKRCLFLHSVSRKNKFKGVDKILNKNSHNLSTLLRFMWLRRHSLPISCMLGIDGLFLDIGDEMILAEAFLSSLVFATQKTVLYSFDEYFVKVATAKRRDISRFLEVVSPKSFR